MLCGELTASSAMVMAAVDVPAFAGAKCPWMLHFVPAATLAPHVFEKANEAASEPVTEMPVMDSASFPVLVRVTDCDALAVPTACAPNDKEVADNDAIAPSPVPLSAMLCGEPSALSAMVIAAAMAPTVVGAKCP